MFDHKHLSTVVLVSRILYDSYETMVVPLTSFFPRQNESLNHVTSLCVRTPCAPLTKKMEWQQSNVQVCDCMVGIDLCLPVHQSH